MAPDKIPEFHRKYTTLTQILINKPMKIFSKFIIDLSLKKLNFFTETFYKKKQNFFGIKFFLYKGCHAGDMRIELVSLMTPCGSQKHKFYLF